MLVHRYGEWMEPGAAHSSAGGRLLDGPSFFALLPSNYSGAFYLPYPQITPRCTYLKTCLLRWVLKLTLANKMMRSRVFLRGREGREGAIDQLAPRTTTNGKGSSLHSCPQYIPNLVIHILSHCYCFTVFGV